MPHCSAIGEAFRALAEVRRRPPTRTGRGTLAIGATVLGLWVAGCAGKQAPPDRISSPGEALFNGRSNPNATCYNCHNGDGSGTWRGPDLAKHVPKMTDQDIVAAIMKGPGLMPSFKDKVSEAEAREIARWLLQRFPAATRK